MAEGGQVAVNLALSVVGSVVAAWGEQQRRDGLKPETVRRRCDDVRSLARFAAPRSVLDATRDDVEAWLTRNPPLSAKTRYGYLSTVHVFFQWAIVEELAERDPTARIRRPKLRKYLPRPIPPADLEVALRAADARMRSFLVLGALEGLRCKEIAGLDREDVQEYNEPPVLFVRAGKGDKERVVPLHPMVAMSLEVAGLPRSGALFTSRTGRRLQPADVSAQINRFLHGLGIAATAHQLRHRFGSDAYRVSRDLRLVQELLGHASPTTTAVYAAWSPHEAVQVVNQLTLPGLVP